MHAGLLQVAGLVFPSYPASEWCLSISPKCHMRSQLGVEPKSQTSRLEWIFSLSDGPSLLLETKDS